MHVQNGVMELGSLSTATTTVKDSKSQAEVNASSEGRASTVTHDLYGTSSAEHTESYTDGYDIPDSLQTRNSFGDHEVFRTGQGSLNPSHAGGIWF